MAADLPVLATDSAALRSGLPVDEALAQAVALGACAGLRKPFKPAALLAAIGECLNNRFQCRRTPDRNGKCAGCRTRQTDRRSKMGPELRASSQSMSQMRFLDLKVRMTKVQRDRWHLRSALAIRRVRSANLWNGLSGQLRSRRRARRSVISGGCRARSRRDGRASLRAASPRSGG